MNEPSRSAGRGRQRERLEPSQYTIVWFCATEEESQVARACLDKRHEAPTLSAPSDTYFHYGEINGDHAAHSLVIVRPTHSGKVAMANAASHVRQNFPNIKYSFFVGIAGGLPHMIRPGDPANVLRRGDVVIAQAQSGSSAVLEYDYANYYAENNFQPKWPSDNTAPDLQSLSNSWLEDHRDGYSDANDLLATLIEKWPEFAAPAPADDVLFQPQDQHWGPEDDCSACLQRYAVTRGRTDRWDRGCYKINVHRGLIVTGDRVIRDSKLRAAIKTHAWGQYALCADMESAVLMENFHPLIVRGISDYADSHYGWKWVRYAAATAAAVAKDMITRIQPTRLVSPGVGANENAPSQSGNRPRPGSRSGGRSSGYHIQDNRMFGKLVAQNSVFSGGNYTFN